MKVISLKFNLCYKLYVYLLFYLYKKPWILHSATKVALSMPPSAIDFTSKCSQLTLFWIHYFDMPKRNVCQSGEVHDLPDSLRCMTPEVPLKVTTSLFFRTLPFLMMLFWVFSPCRLLFCRCQVFGERICFSYMLVSPDESTRYQNPEHGHARLLESH